VTCATLLRPIKGDADIRQIQVCKEDEGVSICAGLSYCDRHAVLLIQYTGFLDSINTVRAIAVEYRLSVMMIVGLQGLEDGRPPPASDKLGMRIMEPIMQAMQTRVN